MSSSKKRALITGINGQDGSYLAEFLLGKDYEVHGIVKRNSVNESQFTRIDPIRTQIELFYADISDIASLTNAILQSQPDQIYNLSAPAPIGRPNRPSAGTIDTGQGNASRYRSVRQRWIYVPPDSSALRFSRYHPAVRRSFA